MHSTQRRSKFYTDFPLCSDRASDLGIPVKLTIPSILRVAFCGVLFFAVAACEQSADDSLSRRQLQLVQEENARLVALVARIDPDNARTTALENGKSTDQNVAVLSAANERLRGIYRSDEQRRSAEKNLVVRTGIERAVEEIRGLKFKKPVQYEVLDRKDIRAALRKRMDAVFSPEEFEEYARAQARIGLLPEKFALREKLIALLGEQVAAFYDQHEHRLYMYSDATLENSMNRVILSHELMHAMQDQHFTLSKLPLTEKHNDDSAVAASALIEGEATLLMGDYAVQNPSAGMVLENLGAMFMQNTAELATAPRYLSETLIFPYQQGIKFASYGMDSGGWEAISRAFANPPRSTSQILHPEKYWGVREDPLRVEWADLKFEGKPAQVDNVVGELGVRILFTNWHDAAVAAKASEGWRGDRYLSFASGDCLVWKTIWASNADAIEFFAAEEALLRQRYKAQSPVSVERRWESNRPRALRLVRNDRAEVLLVDAPDSAKALALEEQFGR